jgi:ribonuclease P protein component
LKVLKEGEKIKGEDISLFCLFNSDVAKDRLKVGISISSKMIKKPTQRNRIKRLIIEAYRGYKASFKKNSGAILFKVVKFDERLFFFNEVKRRVYLLLKEAKLI